MEGGRRNFLPGRIGSPCKYISGTGNLGPFPPQAQTPGLDAKAHLDVETSKGGAPTPLFFVSVADKGLSPAASLLLATLAGGSISVADKGLMGADR